MPTIAGVYNRDMSTETRQTTNRRAERPGTEEIIMTVTTHIGHLTVDDIADRHAAADVSSTAAVLIIRQLQAEAEISEDDGFDSDAGECRLAIALVTGIIRADDIDTARRAAVHGWICDAAEGVIENADDDGFGHEIDPAVAAALASIAEAHFVSKHAHR